MPKNLTEGYAMSEEMPAVIRNQLEEFIIAINEALPDLLDGFYIYGSLAMGNFHPKSDIDFLAILKQPCTENDIKHLRAIHHDFAKRYPQHEMHGCFLQKLDIGKLNEEIPAYPFCDGTMHAEGHFDINLITWWILKHHGITLYGDDIRSFDFDLQWETIQAYLHENINSYWQTWASSPIHFAYLLKDSAIEWTVLSILRLYYSMREGGITSKIGAGEYALLHLPKKWHPLIQHALYLRDDKQVPYKNRFVRQQEARQFLRYMINECNQIVG